MESIVISGAGIVSEFGVSKGTFQNKITSNNIQEKITPEEMLVSIQNLRIEPPFNEYDFGNWRAMDQLSKYALMASLLALADAGMDRSKVAPKDWGIFFGTVFGCVESNVLFNQKLLTSAPRFVSRTTFSNTVSNAAIGYIALLLEARGTQMTTASGGAYPLLYAMQQLQAGRVRVALVGGMERLVALVTQGLAERGLISNEATKPFAPEAQGFLPHEGAGALFLEKSADCHKRGGQALAEVLSYGVGADFAQSMHQALTRTGLQAEAIDLLVPQANGTRWDAPEEVAIKQVFTASTSRPTVCPIKAQIGECFGAGLVFSIVAVLPQLAPGQLLMVNAASFDSRSKATFILKKLSEGAV